MTNPFNGKPFEQTDVMTRILWHLVQFVIMLVVAVGFYFRMDFRITNIEKLAASNYASLQDMNEHGTTKSQQVDAVQGVTFDELSKRTANLESILRDVVPRVERIDANVMTLMQRNKQ